MGDFRVVEAPYNVDKSVSTAKQIHESTAFHLSIAHGPGIKILDLCVHRGRFEQVREALQPRVRDIHHGLVKFIEGRGELGYLHLLIGQQVEQKCFTGFGVSENG